MRSLWFVSLTFLLFLAACGRSTNSRSIKQGEVNPGAIAGDTNSGSVKNYALEPVKTTPLSTKVGSPPLLQAVPHKFTVNTEEHSINFTAELKVDGQDLGLVEFNGTIDQKEHLAHLQSKNRDTQATVLCLDMGDCLDSAVVIYHRYKNKNLEVQFRTKNGTPATAPPTQVGIYDDEDVALAPLSPLKPKPPVAGNNPGQNTAKPAPPKTMQPEAPLLLEEEDDGAEGESTGFVGQLPVDLRPIGTTGLSGTLPQAIERQTRGSLINAEQLPNKGKGYIRMRRDSVGSWGTTLLIRVLTIAAAEMADKYPNRPPLLVGDISKKNGGPFGYYNEKGKWEGHKSHQNGLDMDIGFPRKKDWLTGFVNTVLQRNTIDSRVDLERIWVFAKLMASSKHLINIYTATAMKNAICGYVRSIGEFPKSTDDLSYRTLNRLHYIPGHHDHMHVRLQCPSTSTHCRLSDPIPAKGTGCPNSPL